MDSKEPKRTPVFTVKAVCPNNRQTILYPSYGPVRVFDAPQGCSGEGTEPDYIVYLVMEDGENMEIRVGGVDPAEHLRKTGSVYDYPYSFGTIFVTDAAGHTVHTVRMSNFNAASPARANVVAGSVSEFGRIGGSAADNFPLSGMTLGRQS